MQHGKADQQDQHHNAAVVNRIHRLRVKPRPFARRWSQSNAWTLLDGHQTASDNFHQTAFVMKAVILAGGLGTRLSEETHLKPKPMVEVGGKPILWHILKIYSSHGINDFVVCCGYKGYMIKELSLIHI